MKPLPADVLRTVAERVLGRETASRRVVICPYAELPREIRAAAERQAGDDAVDVTQAVFWNRTCYLVEGAFAAPHEVERAIFHEYFGHFGLRMRFQRELEPVLDSLFDRAGGREGVIALAEAHGIRLRSTARALDADDRIPERQRRWMLMDELLAHVAETSGSLRFWVNAFIGEVREWFRRRGWMTLAQVTTSDLARIVVDARQAALAVDDAKATGVPAPLVPVFRRVWHGSPYRGIEQEGFKLVHVGRGEGSQAFGYGIYFASRRDVAEFYRNQFVDRSGLSTPGEHLAAKALAQESGDRDAAIARLVRGEDVVGGPVEERSATHYVDRARSKLQFASGQLYQVTIPDDDDLLDWDKPLAEQPPRVASALRTIQPLLDAKLERMQARRHVYTKAPEVMASEWTGQDAYECIQDWFVNDDHAWHLLGTTPDAMPDGNGSRVARAASLYLGSIGIPGLRFRDGTSRAVDDRANVSCNYVIWDESVLTPTVAQITPMFSRRQPTTVKQPIFYSALVRAVEEARGAPLRADAATWSGWLDGAMRRGAFRKAEREWSAVDAWLRSRDMTTRDELRDYVEAHQVRIEEVVLEKAAVDLELPVSTQDISVRPDPEDPDFWIADCGQKSIAVSRLHYEDPAEAGRFAERYFNDHIKERNRERLAAADHTYHAVRTLPGGDHYRELLLTMPHDCKVAVPDAGGVSWRCPGVFRAGHFGSTADNVLVHVRFKEWRDIAGVRTLLIDEIQSDWHQRGRRDGYEPTAECVKKADADKPVSMTVPPAPFAATDEWVMLGFRRIVRWAVDNGFDQVAWTTGDQQVERYQLRRQLDRVYAKCTAPDQYELTVHDRDGACVYDSGGYAIAGTALSKVVGSSLAERIVADASSDGKTYSNVDVAVGGEGLQSFYDGIVRNAVARWSRSFGVRIDSTTLMTEPLPSDDPDETAITDDGEVARTVHAIRINDAMRASVSEGVPMFRRASSVDDDENNNVTRRDRFGL